MSVYEMEEQKECMILVGVQLNENEKTEESLDELAELVETAKAGVAGRVIQNREAIHPVTYVGKGKLEEIKEYIASNYVESFVILDDINFKDLGFENNQITTKYFEDGFNDNFKKEALKILKRSR